MNAYEQLLVIRDRLEHNGASEDSIDLVDKFISRAVSEQQSETTIAMTMMVRHLLRQREAIDNYAIYNDLQELIEEPMPTVKARAEDSSPYAYEEEHKPRSHAYYKQQKAKEKETKK